MRDFSQFKGVAWLKWPFPNGFPDIQWRM